MNRVKEKTYKRIKHAGILSLVLGIIIITGGTTLGTLNIINGSKLLSSSKKLRDLL